VKCIHARISTAVLFLAFATGAVPSSLHGVSFSAQAQNLGQRNVSGAVVDGNSAPVAGATVFLKNQKTKAIRSYTSGTDGRFHFAQVNMAEDYDLWAEKDNRKTAIKTVSSWDARKEFETELRMK
jgi:hypothetical protein